MFDVLFLTYDDNANTGYRFWQCARHLGLNSAMFKGVRHSFGYPKQAPIHPSLANTPICTYPTTIMAPGTESLINSSKVIHLIASTYPMAAVKWEKKKVVIQHGGSVYRQNPKASNDFFNGFVDKTIIQCPDLLGLGAKDEVLIYYPIDTNLIQPDFSKKGKSLVVGHFPSNPQVKGSKEIFGSISAVSLNHDIEYHGWHGDGSNGVVSWPSNLKRMKASDVIVECCAPDQNGKPYGEWGNTALEAAASGCIVISNAVHRDIYEKEYGPLGVHVANDPESMKAELIRLSELSDGELMAEKKACRQWAEKYHSIPATAERLWNRVYSRYF